MTKKQIKKKKKKEREKKRSLCAQRPLNRHSTVCQSLCVRSTLGTPVNFDLSAIHFLNFLNKN